MPLYYHAYQITKIKLAKIMNRKMKRPKGVMVPRGYDKGSVSVIIQKALNSHFCNKVCFMTCQVQDVFQIYYLIYLSV